jgi:hypothetical protein
MEKPVMSTIEPAKSGIRENLQQLLVYFLVFSVAIMCLPVLLIPTLNQRKAERFGTYKARTISDRIVDPVPTIDAALQRLPRKQHPSLGIFELISFLLAVLGTEMRDTSTEHPCFVERCPSLP